MPSGERGHPTLHPGSWGCISQQSPCQAPCPTRRGCAPPSRRLPRQPAAGKIPSSRRTSQAFSIGFFSCSVPHKRLLVSLQGVALRWRSQRVRATGPGPPFQQQALWPRLPPLAYAASCSRGNNTRGGGGGAGGDHHTRACAPVDRVLNASRPPTVSRTLPWKAKGPIPPYKSRVPPAPKPLDNSGSDEATAPVGPHQRPQVAATGLGLGGAKQAALPPEHTGSPERPTGRPAPDNGALFPRRPRSTPARQAALLGRGKGREPPGRGRRGRASGSPGLR